MDEHAGPPALVLDTNIVLDLLVFRDPATAHLKSVIDGGRVRWLVTYPMRDEFERVLGYPKIAAWMQAHGAAPAHRILEDYDRLSLSTPPACSASVRCTDRDDQIFIDLAVAHRAWLISKDSDVLRLRKRLAVFGAIVHNLWDGP